MRYPRHIQRCVIGLVTLLLLFPHHIVMAAPSTAAVLRLAVIPVADQRSDEVTQELAKALGDAMARLGPFRLVPSTTAVSSMQYLAPAQAEGGGDEVHAMARQLAEAKRHYLRFETREATAKLTAVGRYFVAHPDAQRTHGQLYVDALLAQALDFQGRGARHAMSKNLQQVMTIAPHLDTQATTYPPSIRAGLAEARRDVVRRGTGGLDVTSRPAVADVTINGVLAGKTPLHLGALPVGTYTVEVQAPNYRSQRQAITIRQGAMATLHPRLRWQRVHRRERVVSLQTIFPMVSRLRLDRAVLLNVQVDAARGGVVEAQLIDGVAQVAHRPLRVRFDRERRRLHADMATMASQLAEAAIHPLRDAKQIVAVSDQSAPSILDQRRRRVSPWVWAGAGSLVVGGVVAGLVLAASGSALGTGALVVRF